MIRDIDQALHANAKRTPQVHQREKSLCLCFGYPNWPRQRPGNRTHNLLDRKSALDSFSRSNQITDLALTKSPEIHSHADEIINARVRALVQQQRGETADGVDDKTRLDAAMHGSSRKPGERVFPCETQNAQEQVNDLQDGNRAHSTVEVGGQKVPEDFWPEEAFESSSNLIC